MSLDLSPELVILLVAFGVGCLVIVAIVCSGRAEEMDAGLVVVCPEPVPGPEQADFFADIQAVFEPAPEELPADEVQEVNRRFEEIVALNPRLDRRLTAIVAAAKAIPAQRRSEEDPK